MGGNPPKLFSDEDEGAAGSEATRITGPNRRDSTQMAPVRQYAYLIALNGDVAGQMFKVENEEIVVGRAPNVDVRVNDEGVSRRHARLARVASTGELVIEDLGSANGTRVNGRRITREVLKDGDKIQLGDTTILKFSFSDNLDVAFQRKMYEAAVRDGLTKAYNKKVFLERLDGEFAYARRHKTPLSLVLFDIDHFKKVNDQHGHLAGDQVLVEVSRVAAAAVRTEDVFARYGGEEFAVIARGLVSDQAKVLAERLRSMVANAPVTIGGGVLAVTISVGVATMPDIVATSPHELIEAADQALYAAKGAGRNCVRSR